MKKNILIGSLLILLSISCKKDLDLNKYDEGLSFEPEFGAPVAQIKLNMSDLLSPDSNIYYDSEGLIHFTFRQDSIADFPVDSLIKIPAIPAVNQGSKLGVIEVADFSANAARTLSDLSSGFNSSTQAAIALLANTTNVFPAINEPNNTLTNFPAPSNFASITFASGFLVMEFRNYLKVSVNSLSVNVYSASPIQTLIGTVNFANVSPNGIKKDSINLTGKTMGPSLAYTIPTFNSASSGSPIFINLSDSIVINAGSSNIKAYSGEAVFPSQSLDPQYSNFDIKGDDPTTRLRNIGFKSGDINYTISTTIKEQLNLKITFEGATKNSLPMAPILITLNNNTVSNTIDLTNVNFNLGLDGGQPYNRMKVKIEPSIVSSGLLRVFDSSDYITAEFTFANIGFKSLDGYLGERVITVDPGSINLDMLGAIKSGLYLDDPKMFIKTNNSIGLPLKFAMNVTGIADDGRSEQLGMTPFTIPYPSLSQRGTSISNSQSIDKTNSNLVNLIALPPTKINYGGSVTLNEPGFNGYNDFIDQNGRITVGIEMDMPFALKTSNLTLSDTTTNPLYSNGKLIGDLDPEKVSYIELITQVENGFPFEGGFMLYFADSNFNIKDSMETPQLLTSAIVDANGRTSATTKNVSAIRFDSARLKSIKNQNLTQMMFRVTMNTFDNGTKVVKVYSDYEAKIAVSVKTKMKIDVIKPKKK